MSRSRPRVCFAPAFVVIAACGDPAGGGAADADTTGVCVDDPSGPTCNPPAPDATTATCDLDGEGTCRECSTSWSASGPSLCRALVRERDPACGDGSWGPRCVAIADASCPGLSCYDAITVGGDANVAIVRRTEDGFVSSVVPGSHLEASSFAWAADRLAFVTADGAAVARAVAGWDAQPLEIVIDHRWPSSCTTAGEGGPRLEWFHGGVFDAGSLRYTSACGTFEARDVGSGAPSVVIVDDGPGAALAGGLVVAPDALRWWADGDAGPRGPGGTSIVPCDTDGDLVLEVVIVGPAGLELVRPRADSLTPERSPWIAGSFRHVACADLGGDGDDEVIASSVDGPVVIVDGDASVAWASTESFAGQGVGTGDLDGDDDVDLVVAEDGLDAPLHVYWNAGAAPYGFTHEVVADPLPGHATRQVTVHHLP